MTDIGDHFAHVDGMVGAALDMLSKSDAGEPLNENEKAQLIDVSAAMHNLNTILFTTITLPLLDQIARDRWDIAFEGWTAWGWWR